MCDGNNIKTFKELYNYLRKEYNEEDIYIFLDKNWNGKDKQESIFRLFAKLGLINKLKNFKICNGNYNNGDIYEITKIEEIFKINNKKINLNDKGDASDLTGINNNSIMATTSKNLNNYHINKLDIEKITTIYNDIYKKKYLQLILCIVVKNTKKFKEIINRSEKTNNYVKKYILNDTTIIIDWDDLNESYKRFKDIYGCKELKDIKNNNKKPLILKLHQEMSVLKSMELINKGEKQILWGHIQRSGKSYIICGTIIEHSKKMKKCNYLIITTAPNETIIQYENVLNCMQLIDYKIINLNGKNKNVKLKNKNIIICSKQFLQTKNTDKRFIEWLKKIELNIIFLDESHNGGTTELSQNTLNYYKNNNTVIIQITATYSKPIKDYKINKKNWILWDLEDIKYCKNIDNDRYKKKLLKKHGVILNNIIGKYSLNNIKEEYSKYPELHILTNELNNETKEEIIKITKNNNYGWSTDGVFILKQNNKEIIDEFQNEKANLDLWYRIFGKYDKYNIPDKEYEKTFMKRIENICNNEDLKSRFYDTRENRYDNEIMTIMAFLPQNNISKISKATKNLLEKYNVIPNLEIVIINSIDNSNENPKNIIEQAKNKVRNNNNKNGILVLSGKQCSLGVTIHGCDIVLLLNNTKSFDTIYQMMFRCMTEGKNKKCGFVIDLNIHRVIEQSIIDYALLVKPKKELRNSIKYILKEKLINLNNDDWNINFNKKQEKLNELCNTIYSIYLSNSEKTITNCLNRLELNINNDDKKIINDIFKDIKLMKTLNSKLKNSVQENDNNIKKGIEKVKNECKNENNEIEKNKNNIDYMDILRHIIPLICILTINYKDTLFVNMFNIIKNNNHLCNILLEQTKTWWGEKIKNDLIYKLITIYIKYMNNNKEINNIVSIIKELFIENKYKPEELSKLIDKYLIPQEYEKKKNAEISTPYELRQEMLDKIPKQFWEKPRRVFEPCCGKGGFVIDIVNRFMNGLENLIPNKDKRYKIIVEKCLYFSDINPTNIFICKLLLDPDNKYKLKYNEGNTLELDIKNKWDIEGFHGVIGNPPYNLTINNRNILWNLFVKKSIDVLKEKGLLLYVHPALWRKPISKKSKLFGLYDIMTKKNTIIYLEIHNTHDGIGTFKCGTRYDWYLLKKMYNNNYKTIIIDENKKKYYMNIGRFNWLPNSNYELLHKITNKTDKINIIYSRSAYGNDKKWTNRVKTDKFKYPCVLSTPKKGIRYMYSEHKNNGHFNVKKIIFGETSTYNSFYDINGDYGLTDGVIAIQEDDKKIADNILKAIKSEKFNLLLKSCSWSNYRIEWNMFKDFNKDFWKEFI
jgi:hypothetical protein